MEAGAIIAAMLLAGVAAYEAYDWYKFPPGTAPDESDLLKTYGPVWSGDPMLALAALAISPGTGVFFYNPALLISLFGFRPWYRSDRVFSLAMAAAATVFVLFISLLAFYKGDPAWGPRYLTPIFAVLWIFAPAGSRRLRGWVVIAALCSDCWSNSAALSIDPLRLQVERDSPHRLYGQFRRSISTPHTRTWSGPTRDHRRPLDPRPDGPLPIPRTGRRCCHHSGTPR